MCDVVRVLPKPSAFSTMAISKRSVKSQTTAGIGACNVIHVMHTMDDHQAVVRHGAMWARLVPYWMLMSVRINVAVSAEDSRASVNV